MKPIKAVIVYKSLMDKSIKEVDIHIQDKKDIERFMDDILENNGKNKNVMLIAGENKVVPVPIMVWDWRCDTAILYKIVAVRIKSLNVIRGWE